MHSWRLVIGDVEVDCFANPISAAVAATEHYGEALWWESPDGRQWLAWSHGNLTPERNNPPDQ